jgi:N-methylhydantoinase B/acetone carboxylase alpha subunit
MATTKEDFERIEKAKETKLRRGKGSVLKGAEINLLEKIQERDRLFRETGRFLGMQRLELMESDPIKFDKFQWRLMAAVNAARETSKYVSGSPASVGMAELVDLLCLPEGDVVAASAGLVGHIASLPIFIRKMAELGYEDNPGIRDTDVWGANDPQMGCPHPADMYTFLPLFYEGELVAWVCGANHNADVGHALCAGGVPVFSPTAYCDGFVYGPERIGERVGDTYELYQPHLNLFTHRTRAGTENVLDAKMRLTGAIMLRQRVYEIIKDFGIDYFKQGMRELLERERQAISNRFKNWMVPGLYRQTCFRPIFWKGLMTSTFPQADKNWVTHHNQFIALDADGKCRTDLSGTSSQDYFWCNGAEGGFMMGATFSSLGFIGMTPLVNTGLFYTNFYDRPPGSLTNVTRRDLSLSFGNAMGTWHGTMSARAWAMATYLRGYLEEAYLYEQDWELFGGEAVTRNGIPWSVGDFTYEGANPRGPSCWRDGEPIILGAGNPESDFGESEEWEYMQPPLLTISRALIRDFVCHGRQRGAPGITLTQLVVDPGKYMLVNASGYGGSAMNAVSVGMCGGYPHMNSKVVYFHDTNAFELIKAGQQLPRNFVEAYRMIKEGKLKVGKIDDFPGHESPPIQVKHGDLICHADHAGSAWGDPIERKLALIVKDLEADLISPEVAKSVYGAIVKPLDKGRWEVGEAASANERKKIRAQRKSRAVPARELFLGERKMIMDGKFGRQELAAMFGDSLKYDKWRDHFCSFWQVKPEALGVSGSGEPLDLDSAPVEPVHAP